MAQQAEVIISPDDFQKLKLFEQKFHEQHSRHTETQLKLNKTIKQLQFSKLKNEVLMQQKNQLKNQIDNLIKETQLLRDQISRKRQKDQNIANTSASTQIKIKQLESIYQNNKRAIKNFETEITVLKGKIQQLRDQKSDLNKLVQQAELKERQKEEERAKIASRQKQLIMKAMETQKQNNLLNTELKQLKEATATQIEKLEGQNRLMLSKINILLTNKEEYTRQYLRRVEEELLANNEINKVKQIDKIMANEIVSFIGFLNSYKK